MTAGERLKLLAGHGGTAGALLLAIGVGATAGAALVNYSGLASGTAAQHLQANAISVDTVLAYYGNGAPITRREDSNSTFLARLHREDEEIIAVIINAVTSGMI